MLAKARLVLETSMRYAFTDTATTTTTTTTGHSDVKYDGPRPVNKAGLEPLGSNGLAPLDPHGVETDVQLDHFMPFEHYLPKRQAVSLTQGIINVTAAKCCPISLDSVDIAVKFL